MTIEDAIDKFLADLAIGQSSRTVSTYATALNRFREYLCQTPLPPSTVPTTSLTIDHAIDFVHWLVGEHFRGRDVPKSTLRTYLAALARFYTYLIRERLASIPADDHERLKHAYRDFRKGGYRRLPKLASEEVVVRLVQAARSVPPQSDLRRELCRLRNVAILETLRCTGMRVGELVRMCRGDVDAEQHTATVIGKEDKERPVYFDDAAWHAIRVYLDARGDGVTGRALAMLPVFARHDRGAGDKVLPISTNTVRRVFTTHLKMAGIEQPLTPHSLRHSFATKALEVTGDLAMVQDLLGHASPATTRIYAHINSRRLHEAHGRIFGYDARDEETERRFEPA